jgi:hypothetical protein
MKCRLTCAALAALLALACLPLLAPNGTALAAGNVGATGFTVTTMTPPTLMGDTEGDGAPLLASAYLPSTRYESSRYRPRRERYHDRGYARARGVSQLHIGFLDPDGAADPGFVVGFRGGQQVDDMFQIGLGVDWRNKSGRATEVVQETVGPGGEVIRVRRDLSRYSSNLFPGIAYLQLSGPSNLGVIPYFGAAGSWQVLFLNADDFQTGQSFDATYDGFGWQLWGGAAVPLSGRSRLVGEVFLNDADLSRDVFDSASGTTIRETVSTDGVGARFGVNWGF